MSPSTGLRRRAAKAASKSSGLSTSTKRMVRWWAAAARSRARRYRSAAGYPRLRRTAMRDTPGTSASSSTSITTCALPRRPAEVDESALDVGVEQRDAHAVADVEPLRSTDQLSFHLRLQDADPGALRGRA